MLPLISATIQRPSFFSSFQLIGSFAVRRPIFPPTAQLQQHFIKGQQQWRRFSICGPAYTAPRLGPSFEQGDSAFTGSFLCPELLGLYASLPFRWNQSVAFRVEQLDRCQGWAASRATKLHMDHRFDSQLHRCSSSSSPSLHPPPRSEATSAHSIAKDGIQLVALR